MAKKKITEQTKSEAEKSVAVIKEVRKSHILKALEERPKSARAIAYELGFTERNAVAPRLTELAHDGLVEVCGSEKDATTGRTVAVYRKAEK